jgi:hypothetical protein
MIHGTAALEWSSLTALTSLELGFGVTDDGARTVGTLTALTSLDIACCALNTVDALSSLHALETLNLNGCEELSDLGTEQLHCFGDPEPQLLGGERHERSEQLHCSGDSQTRPLQEHYH